MDTSEVVDLDLRTKVGQLFVAGFRGPEVGREIRELIVDHHLGNVIVFERNVDAPEQVASLTARLQHLALDEGAAIPLLVTVDQEGGTVTRLEWGSELPGQMCLGATRNADLARRAGQAVGQELATLGINCNFAPVLDVNNNANNPVIGNRSFGEDPELVGELGTAMAAGMQAQGVLACGKHFPGHGDTTADSHHELPVVDHDRERLDRIELPPFERVIANGIEAIMTAHVAVPEITGDRELPATLSPAIQTDLLREDLGFEGLLVTDCLEMAAIANGVGTAEGAVRAIEAGCDLVLVSHTFDAQTNAMDAVVEAVQSGRIDEARLDRSLERVLAAKAPSDVGVRDTAGSDWRAAADRTRTVGAEIAAAGITLLRDRTGSIPLDTDDLVHVVGFGSTSTSPAEGDKYDLSYVGSGLVDAGFDVRLHETTDTTDRPSPPADAQVVAAVNEAGSDPLQAECVEALDDDHDSFVALLVNEPYDFAAIDSVSTALATYDYTAASLEAAGHVLAGDRDPRGTLPVTVAGLEP